MHTLITVIQTHVLAEIEHQKKNFFLWVPIFFAFGIAIYFSLRFEPVLWVSILCAALTLCGALLLSSFTNLLLRSWQICILWGLLIISLGFTAAQIRTIWIDQPVIERSMGPVALYGDIAKIDYLPKGVRRVYLQNLDIERLRPDEMPHQIRLHFRPHLGDVTLGQRVHVLAQLHPAGGPVYPGGFDFQRYAYFQRIGAVGFGYKMLSDVTSPETSNVSTINKIRENALAQINDALGEHVNGIVSALLIGHKRAIPDEDLQAIRDAGLAHILAISGLHLGIVCGFVFFAVRFGMALFPSFALRRPIKKYAAVFAILAGAFYMLLAGATIPTQRAFMMSVFVFGAILFDRSPFSLRFLAFAGLIILIIRPESLVSISFQMSFAAVAALIAFYEATAPHIKAFYRGRGRIMRVVFYILSIAVTSLIASLATGLISIFHFQHFSVAGIFSNVLIIPLLAFWIMPLGVLSLFLMIFNAAELPLRLMGYSIEWLLSVAHMASDYHWAALDVPAMPLAAFLIAVIGFTCLILGRLFFRAIGMITILCGLVIGFFDQKSDIVVLHPMQMIGFVSQDDKLILKNTRKNGFTRENWQSYFNIDPLKTYSFENYSDDGSNGFSCDEKACRLKLKGYQIAFVHHISALPEECLWADIVIAQFLIRRGACSRAFNIDMGDTKREKGYAISLKEQGISVKPIQSGRGERPWVF